MTTVTTPPKFYTPYELAEILGVTPRSVYLWAAQGKIKRVKLRSAVRIPASEIERLTETGAL